MLTPLAITFLINIVTSALKNYVFPKWGKIGVQFIVFVFACAGAAWYLYLQNIESIHNFIVATLGFFAMAVSLYEVILSYFPFFRPSDTRQDVQAEVAVDNVLEK